MAVCVYIYECLQRPEKRMGSLDVGDIQVAVSCQVWVLGTELWSSTRRASFRNLEPSLTHKRNFLQRRK